MSLRAPGSGRPSIRLRSSHQNGLRLRVSHSRRGGWTAPDKDAEEARDLARYLDRDNPPPASSSRRKKRRR